MKKKRRKEGLLVLPILKFVGSALNNPVRERERDRERERERERRRRSSFSPITLQQKLYITYFYAAFLKKMALG